MVDGVIVFCFVFASIHQSTMYNVYKIISVLIVLLSHTHSLHAHVGYNHPKSYLSPGDSGIGSGIPSAMQSGMQTSAPSEVAPGDLEQLDGEEGPPQQPFGNIHVLEKYLTSLASGSMHAKLEAHIHVHVTFWYVRHHPKYTETSAVDMTR